MIIRIIRVIRVLLLKSQIHSPQEIDPRLRKIAVILTKTRIRVIPVNPGIGLVFSIEEIVDLQAEPQLSDVFWFKIIANKQVVDKIRIKLPVVTGGVIDELLADIFAYKTDI